MCLAKKQKCLGYWKGRLRPKLWFQLLGGGWLHFCFWLVFLFHLQKGGLWKLDLLMCGQDSSVEFAVLFLRVCWRLFSFPWLDIVWFQRIYHLFFFLSLFLLIENEIFVSNKDRDYILKNQRKYNSQHDFYHALINEPNILNSVTSY